MIDVRPLSKKFKALAKKRKELEPEAVAGYAAPYAVHVHENMEAHHENGQAKFLEEPARRMRNELARIVRDRVAAGDTLAEAELAAMQALLAASKPLVPVATVVLRDSGFATVTEGS